MEGLMLKLKLQYLGHLMQRVDSLEKILMLGGIGSRRKRDRGWDGWMASLTRWTWVWVNSGSWWWTGRPGMLQFMGSQRVWHDWATELNWTELKHIMSSSVLSIKQKKARKADREWEGGKYNFNQGCQRRSHQVGDVWSNTWRRWVSELYWYLLYTAWWAIVRSFTLVICETGCHWILSRGVT